MSSRVYDHRPLGHQHAPPSSVPPPLGLGGPPLPPNVPSGIIPPPPLPPHAARLNEILDYVRAEFDSVVGDSSNLRAQREEYENMINHHANEINAMRALAYDLERKHHEDRRTLQEENSRLEDEIVRLRREVNSRSIGPPPGGATNNGSTPHAHASRPLLGSAADGNNGPSTRPGSATTPGLGGAPPQVGHGPSNLFGGAMGLPAAGAGDREREREREGNYAHSNGAGSNMRDSPRDSHILGSNEHSNKRQRDEDARYDSHGPPSKVKVPSFAKPTTPLGTSSFSAQSNSRPSSRGPPPLPSSTGTSSSHQQPPTLHHPSPLPPPSNPTIPLRENASPAPPANPPAGEGSAAASSPRTGSAKEGQIEPFDPETVTRDLKKEGSDWMTMFNPNVKRVLDVGLVHTLVHDSVVCCVRFSPDGKILATGCNRNTTLYDTKTGAKISVFIDESVGIKTDNYVRSTSFSPDGKLLATGSEDRIIRIWNIANKRIAKIFQGHKSEIYSLAFSPDGKKLVSGSGDKTARMWDMESGNCLFTLPIDDISLAENGTVDAGVTSVVMSPDGKFLAAGSLDTVVRIWDAGTGQLLDKLKGHKDSVYSVAFSPDGKFLVSGSLDRTLKMWDMASLKAALAASPPKDSEGTKTVCMTTLQGHKDYVLSVDISPDGAWIVSGSKDRGVQFWDPVTAKAQFMLQGHKNSVISVAVSQAGGNLVATGSGDWSARIWSYEQV